MPTKSAQPAPQPRTANGTKHPVKTFRLGRIKAAVWENEADNKKFYNVTFARTYVDEAKNFHDTDSFGRDDLPLALRHLCIGGGLFRLDFRLHSLNS
jgi:hypothetical protein